jgi:hypothetical protein
MAAKTAPASAGAAATLDERWWVRGRVGNWRVTTRAQLIWVVVSHIFIFHINIWDNPSQSVIMKYFSEG